MYWLCVSSIAKRNPTGSLTLFAWGGCILSVGVVSGAALGRVAYGLLVQSPSAATVVCIQQALGVSYNTVKTHVAHIYAKLGVHTHQELLDFVGRQ